jgi:hypothetical protein
MGLEEGRVGAGRHADLEEGGDAFPSKNLEEAVALGGLPSGAGRAARASTRRSYASRRIRVTSVVISAGT